MADSRVSRSFWCIAPLHGEIREQPVDTPRHDDVIVETWFTAVSRGTESLVFAGAVPDSEFARMRAPFQEGMFPFPVKYGYSAVGRVVEGPDELAGRIVFCLHPHADLFCVPAAAVLALADGVPPARAVLAANAETAVNAVWDALPTVGDRVAVVGGGTLGCLVAWLIGGIPGTRVQLVDIDEGRAEVAAALGVGFATPNRADGDCDLVVHASASEAGLTTALGLAGLEATVLELSWYGIARPAVPLGHAFHAQRLTLKSSQVGRVAPSRRTRTAHRDRLALALGLLCDPRLDVLLTGWSDFADLPRTMLHLHQHPAGALCHVVRYPAAPDQE
ncbi:MAG: zinc-binding alcohol dehydrogenase [Rhodospirillaceae bacterium]|nr:zinc-binding alcohol dehydrogenase [Rhodospirillaceae bacterium]